MYNQTILRGQKLAMLNVFEKSAVNKYIERINGLTNSTRPLWGKMSVGQMLAHLNVAYEMVYTDKHPEPGAFKRWFVTLVAKKAVVGPKPYPRNSRTAPEFLITTERDFDNEKQRLVDYLTKTLELGAAHFDGKESHSFGALTKDEWNVLFSKHLDHHLTQFGV